MNNILIETQDFIQTVTINRPDKLNALNNETLQELKTVFEDLSVNPSVRVVILTGSGPKSFVAGADIKELSDLDPQGAQQISQFGQSVFQAIENCGRPVIAAVNGFALGGGLELALSASFRIASDNAKFGLPEVSLGLIPGYGGTQRLAREVGKGRASYLVSSAEMISADQACQWGVVNEVMTLDKLMPRSLEIASQLSSKSPMALSKALEAINYSYDYPEKDGYAHEAHLFGQCFVTEDMKEGVSAFLEKRAATFSGK